MGRRGQNGVDTRQQGPHNAPPGAYGRQYPQQPGQRPGAPPDSWLPGGQGEPEYFGGQAPVRPPGPYGDQSGQTQSFSLGEAPDYGYAPQDDGYGDGPPHPAAPPAPRLHWKQLLKGIVLRPNATFLQMRDHRVWGPALTVSFLYGLLALFGLEQTREEVLGSTLSTAVTSVLTAAVAVTLSSLVLGTVTHTLARQFGGVGVGAPTIGLSMLIMPIADVPRLLFALFMGGDAPLVQVLGWLTWVAAGALCTLMVSRSHELPWPRALGASSIQLIALLALLKLGTL